MPKSEVIDTADPELFAEITTKVFVAIQGLRVVGIGKKEKTPERLGWGGFCHELSDLATRAAYDLNVVASREKHRYASHHITSFAPLNRLPAEDDLIMCLTWGQFNETGFQARPVGFFGARQAIEPLVGRHYYNGAFDADSVELRQTVHRPSPHSDRGHLWLETTPIELLSGDYPMGVGEPKAFPDKRWLR